MEILKTASGTEFQCDYFNPCIPIDRLNLRILNAPISQVALVFSNPEETIQLWCGNSYAAEFTRLISIMPEGDAIRVVLGKE